MSTPSFLKINISSLPPEGLIREGEVLPDEIGLPDDARFGFPDPVKVYLKIYPVRNGILCQGKADTRVACTCDRCLRSYRHAIRAADVVHFYEHPEEDVLDLTPDVREDILLALPQRTVCAEACRGLCPQCGQNLNTATCDCETGPRKPSVWDALDGLELDNDAN